MVQQQTMNPMATATTPWSTATAHLSHCKAQTETFDLICHMTMFQEELEIPTTTTPWSTATAHRSHCKAQTETFVLICHMPMFQEKLSNPFTLFTFIIIVY